MKLQYIYEITNLLNYKTYIGKHKGLLKDKYYGSGDAIGNSISKYGKHNFKKRIIEICTDETINKREIFWIDKLNPEYNITSGGEGGNTWMFESHPRYNEIYHKRYVIGKQKQSDTLKQTYKDKPELIKNSSLRCKTKNPMFNKETVLKMKETKRLGFMTGKYDHCIKSLKDRSTGIKRSTVSIEKQKQSLKELYEMNPDIILKRNEKIKASHNKPEVLKLTKERMSGISNPGFKWIFIFERDDKKINTSGFTLKDWLADNEWFNAKISSIHYAAKNEKLINGYKITKIHKDNYIKD